VRRGAGSVRRGGAAAGARSFRRGRAPFVGARGFTTTRGSVRARTFTRSPGFGGGRRHIAGGARRGGAGYFKHDRGNHFRGGYGYGYGRHHGYKRSYSSVFFYFPFYGYPFYGYSYPYYGYYYRPYGRYYFYDYPPYGTAPYYYDYDAQPYYYDSGQSYYQPYDQPYEQPYDQSGDQSYDRFRDVREKMERERAAEQAKVSEQLDQIREPFRNGDYARALQRAEQAVNAEPGNAIFGFAYTQALVANGAYDRAADVLRQALNTVNMQTQGVLFGADLYPTPAALQERVADLERTARDRPGDTNLRLLLGYELIAAGRYDDAVEALNGARDYVNLDAAKLLDKVLAQIRDAETAAAGN